MLWLIYGLSFSSAGLLSLGLVPEFRARVLGYLASVRKVPDELEALFISIPRKRLFLIYSLVPVGVTVVGYMLVPNLLVVPIGLAVGLVVPKLIVRIAQAKRQSRFQGQMVDALLVLSGSLKAGLSILQALEVLAEESLAPMSEEVALALKEVRMGLALDEALRRMKRRMPLEELNLLITAILVARETGGDITGVFVKLIETVRDRQKLKERLKTLTVIPRLQGWIMAVIPIVFAMFVGGVSTDYFQRFATDPLGQLLAVGAGLAWIVSLFLIWWFSRDPMR